MGGFIFVTGTDTGVGKTVCAAGMARALRERGLRVSGAKPFATGSPPSELPGDAALLQQASGAGADADVVAPVRLAPPLSPLAAARDTGGTVSLEAAAAALTTLGAEYDVTVVEGVGGVMVPLAEGRTFLDFLEPFRPPVAVVARPTLGTLNHTLLTVRALRQASADVRAVVLCPTRAGDSDASAASNPDILREFTGLPVFSVPYFGTIEDARDIPPGPFQDIVEACLP
jgi:dethiobiotin synthetase